MCLISGVIPFSVPEDVVMISPDGDVFCRTVHREFSALAKSIQEEAQSKRSPQSQKQES